MNDRDIIPSRGYQTKKHLREQRYELILNHILDPENSPLPEKQKIQFKRVISAANMLDDYHPSNVIPRLLAKYRISSNQAREDIELAQELFKSKHKFDYDYWQQWQIKDLVDTIRTCKLKGKQKERIAAQKVLREVMGEKPQGAEDPQRMQRNVFNIQINNNETIVNIPLEKIRGLSPEELQTVVSTMIAPDVDDSQIEELLNT